MQIILASASPRRKELLDKIGLTFNVLPTEIDEEYFAEENPQKRVSLKSEWQKNLDLSHYSMYAGAAVWGINLIWTLATQSEVKKYKNVQFSLLNTSTGPIPTFGWRSNF